MFDLYVMTKTVLVDSLSQRLFNDVTFNLHAIGMHESTTDWFLRLWSLNGLLNTYSQIVVPGPETGEHVPKSIALLIDQLYDVIQLTVGHSDVSAVMKVLSH